jgi:DNA-binding NarL/FixJ family response regulator
VSIRLVLADDHPVVLAGLVSLFRTEPDFEVLAACKDGDEALQVLREHHPDVLILHLRMPGKDGLAVLRAMRQEKLVNTRTMVLTAVTDDHEVLEAIRLGARGVVLKEMAPHFLVQCVRRVAAGGEWLERRSVGHALDVLLKREAGAQEAASALTAREREIVRMLASGLHNKEIASKLLISEGTVKIHLHNIYDKLNVDGRFALMAYAREKGLV